jgi:hypothetical protein
VAGRAGSADLADRQSLRGSFCRPGPARGAIEMRQPLVFAGTRAAGTALATFEAAPIDRAMRQVAADTKPSM